MSHETSKAQIRRYQNADYWNKIMKGHVLDIGPGNDPLSTNMWSCMDEIIPFDKAQGDANKIDEYFPGAKDPYYQVGSFDCIHGSQVMEHLYNPTDFINRCLRILKPGGWIVMTVPDYDLYEKRRFPSRFNPDHKTTWSLWRDSSTARKHIHVPTWIKQFDVAQRYATLIDTNYDYLAPDTKDQTWLREDGVECFIEILLKKHD